MDYKQSVEEAKKKLRRLSGCNLMYDLSHSQQMLDNYVVATNIALFKNTAEFPGLNKQINRLRTNATDIQYILNPAINKVISSINKNFILFYENHILRGNFVDILDRIVNDAINFNYFIQTTKRLDKHIQKIINNISTLEAPSNESRKKGEENARISRKILDKANEKKSLNTVVLKKLNENITCSDKIIKEKLAFISRLKFHIEKTEFIIQVIMQNPWNTVKTEVREKLASLKNEVRESWVAIEEAEKNKEMSLCKIQFIDNSLITVNAVLDKVNNIDHYSTDLAITIENLKLNWLSISHLLSSILEKFTNIRNVDKNIPDFLKEIFLEEFKTIVNSLKDKFALRNKKLAADNSFKINIDPKINRYFNYFPLNANGLISVPSDLIFRLTSHSNN